MAEMLRERIELRERCESAGASLTIREDSSGGKRKAIPGAAARIQLRAGASFRTKGPPRSAALFI